MKVIESSFMNDDWKYWDKFIGEKIFNESYLRKLFDPSNRYYKHHHQTLTQYIIIDKGLCCGVCIVRHIPCTMIFNILLIAKEKESRYKKIGKTFIDHLCKTLPEGSTLILADDSEIPNYYTKLGFTRSYGLLNIYMLEYKHFTYYKKISYKNKIIPM